MLYHSYMIISNKASFLSMHKQHKDAPIIAKIMVQTRTVIDIHFFSIRSLTFYFSIPIISIRFYRTALIEYFHKFHTIFVARILRFPQCKDNEGFLNTF